MDLGVENHMESEAGWVHLGDLWGLFLSKDVMLRSI